MGKLSILGAQRIKALSEMLDEVEIQQTSELRRSQKTSKELKDIIDEEYGLKELRAKEELLELQLREVLHSINHTTGESEYISINTGYSNHKSNTGWKKRYNELQDEQTKDINELKRQFDTKKRSLWLCETLEEAKIIVGLT